MRQCVKAILPLLILASVLLAGDNPKDEGKEAKKATPADQFKEIKLNAQKAEQEIIKKIRAATSREEKQKLFETLYAKRQQFAGQVMELVNQYPKEEIAPAAVVWVAQRVQGTPQGKKAIDLLMNEYFQAKELGQACRLFVFPPTAENEKRLRLILEKHQNNEVKGMAAFNLAVVLKMQSEKFKLDPAEGEKLRKEAEGLLDQVIAKHADQEKLIEEARSWLFELRNLAIGKPVVDIEGEDREGKKFKLSDYRGKVVVLDFWAGWCGPCMAMVPHERDLVKRLEGKPFAFVGVNCDETKNDEKIAEEKHQISWRSWFDGRLGPIAKKWNNQFLPTIYILDAQGVIRYKGLLQEREMDEAVDELLKEMAAKK